LQISEEDFYNALKPEYFVEVRTLTGGPSPTTMRQSLQEANDLTDELSEWVRQKVDNIKLAEDQLEQILKGWDTHE
ncbi:MAG: argininosuccinate lyase, partial [Lysinibacillus sp.]